MGLQIRRNIGESVVISSPCGNLVITSVEKTKLHFEGSPEYTVFRREILGEDTMVNDGAVESEEFKSKLTFYTVQRQLKNGLVVVDEESVSVFFSSEGEYDMDICWITSTGFRRINRRVVDSVSGNFLRLQIAAIANSLPFEISEEWLMNHGFVKS